MDEIDIINTSDQNVSLVEQTQKEILAYIYRNKLELNKPLPKETELAELLGVSRVVIREALSSLRVLGILETKRKKGTVLGSPKIFKVLNIILESGLLDIDSIKDLYELRLMLELGMSDFIFKNKTEEDIARLQKIVEKEEVCCSSDEFRELDIRFHSVLYEITKNTSMVDFQLLLHKLFFIYNPQTPDNRRNSLVSHYSLVEILKKGNAEMFRVAMRMHLEIQFSMEEQYLKEYDIKNNTL